MINTRSFSLAEIGNIPEQRWMVHNVIPERGFAMFYGAPGAFKTFVALEMALSLAYGLEWAGRTGRCRKCYRVAYFAGEAVSGVAKRIEGWRNFHKLSNANPNFILFDGIPQIGTKDGRDGLFTNVTNRFDGAVNLIVFDTLMRASGGVDLNTPSGSQALIDGCDIIRHHYKAAVLLVHHTGKSEARGPLGAENIRAALDNLERIKPRPEKNGVKTVMLIQEKNKDGELRGDLHLALKQVDIPSRIEGNSLTTLVVVPAPVTSLNTSPQKGDIHVRLAVEVLENFPGREFKVRTLADEVWRKMRNENRGKKPAIDSRKIEDKLRLAARRGEFGERAYKKSTDNNACWLFKSNNGLNDL
jgi:hypothetical protein